MKILKFLNLLPLVVILGSCAFSSNVEMPGDEVSGGGGSCSPEECSVLATFSPGLLGYEEAGRALNYMSGTSYWLDDPCSHPSILNFTDGFKPFFLLMLSDKERSACEEDIDCINLFKNTIPLGCLIKNMCIPTLEEANLAAISDWLQKSSVSWLEKKESRLLGDLFCNNVVTDEGFIAYCGTSAQEEFALACDVWKK